MPELELELESELDPESESGAAAAASRAWKPASLLVPVWLEVVWPATAVGDAVAQLA